MYILQCRGEQSVGYTGTGRETAARVGTGGTGDRIFHLEGAVVPARASSSCGSGGPTARPPGAGGMDTARKRGGGSLSALPSGSARGVFHPSQLPPGEKISHLLLIESWTFASGVEHQSCPETWRLTRLTWCIVNLCGMQ